MASSSLDCHRLVEWGRHNELEASMVGVASSHVLGSLQGACPSWVYTTWYNRQCQILGGSAQGQTKGSSLEAMYRHRKNLFWNLLMCWSDLFNNSILCYDTANQPLSSPADGRNSHSNSSSRRKKVLWVRQTRTKIYENRTTLHKFFLIDSLRLLFGQTM